MNQEKKKAGASKAMDAVGDVVARSMELVSDVMTAGTTASREASLASAKRLLQIQKGGVKTGLGVISKVNRTVEKGLRESARKGDWMPPEGKEVIDDWSKMMDSGLEEFTRVVEKSFDLMLKFLDRVAEPKPKAASKGCGKRCAASDDKKKPAAAAKSKAKAKAKPAAKKPAARKSAS